MNSILSEGATDNALLQRLSLFGQASKPLQKRQLAYVVFACPKSGTTWLQRLLSAHAETICCESRTFGDYLGSNASGSLHVTMQKYVQVLSGYFAPAVPGLRAADSSFYQTLLFNWVDALGSTVKSQTGRRVYGEKCTPFRGTAQAVTDTYHAYDPGLKFVHLVRDGRDVIVSGAVQWVNQRRSRGTDAERAEAERQLAGSILRMDDFEMFLDLWTDAVTAGLAAQARFPNYLQLRYEDLLTDAPTWVGRLLAFLEINHNAETVARCVEAASFRALSGGRDSGQEDRNSFFRRGVAGDWRNWFKPEHAQLFQQRAGHLMARLGYNLD